MSGRRIVARVFAVLAAFALCGTVSACGSGLQFSQDHRLRFTSPEDRGTVTLPFRLAWTMHDAPSGSTFAVMLDHNPPPAGEQLSWLFRHDAACRADLGCPTPEFLAENGIYTTRQPQQLIDALSAPTGQQHRGREAHTATVILLDRSGRRIGETAWYREFSIERGAS
ncbi:hypothetical protein [Nonomuraea sp. NPDC046570]|uniref:hypothetical protein n=1 Tax=Nonomuraea sp. NPDC046570 TaxID=3155255 RepID=UPI0033D8E8AD